MKNQLPALIERPHDPELEEITHKTHEELKQLARKNGGFHALRNLPAANEENIEPYVNEFKNGYEKLAHKVMKHLQPDSQFPQARMDIDHLKDRNDQTENDIRDKTHKRDLLCYELGNYNPKGLRPRIRTVLYATLAIALGEVLYNSKAFQVEGDSLLFAIIISISISVAVFCFSHLIPFVLKAVKKRWRLCVLIGSGLFVLALFAALAMFRSGYLAHHGETVSPVNFIIINMFLFTVGGLLSYFLLPTWKEIRDDQQKFRLNKQIENYNAEISCLAEEKERIKNELLERNKMRLRLNYYAQYAINEVASMYKESLGIFQSANLLNRSDRCVPFCFNAIANDIEVSKMRITVINSNIENQ